MAKYEEHTLFTNSSYSLSVKKSLADTAQKSKKAGSAPAFSQIRPGPWDFLHLYDFAPRAREPALIATKAYSYGTGPEKKRAG